MGTILPYSMPELTWRASSFINFMEPRASTQKRSNRYLPFDEPFVGFMFGFIMYSVSEHENGIGETPRLNPLTCFSRGRETYNVFDNLPLWKSWLMILKVVTENL